MTGAPEPTLMVCTHRRLGAAGSCGAAGGAALSEALRRDLAARGLGWSVTETGCLGHCSHGPNIKAAPNGPLLHHCSAGHSEALIERLLAGWTGQG